MPHWHDDNPWRDRVVYVPIERLAECVAGGVVATGPGRIEPYDVPFVLREWRQGGDKLDAYILPQPDGVHSLGVRYGPEGSQYYSPHNGQPAKVRALLAEFQLLATVSLPPV